jgi:uncharacterized protein (DUF58 family)
MVSELLTIQPKGSGTDLSLALEYLEPALQRRTVLFILSDFLTEGFEPALTRAARRHDVIPLQLFDPRERELVPAGLMTLWDEERGAWQTIDTDDEALRTHYREQMAGLDERFGLSLRTLGIDLVRLRTDQSYAEPLIAFFRGRERRMSR